ncbi:F-box/WD repeat-containing protein 9-like isoform X2 [Diaphorina citri]|uniref:F-box/WD repeat-containing protein 9-like isoform X1 n=1 Tax=Diaphorina citri TaxID=121845 RepID=A0A1S3DK13_DIACI|nr:F-box/WD repeat-containing protein 9-like isoform X1 [Diaphorina citri]XP_026687076.1 F-box/WD repeat-containing protein 9-like isoform X2 [Diaphorina citri]
MGSDDHIEANLYTLPNEIFLYICSYLDSIFILECLKNVCRRFDSIISDEYVWRNRTSIDYPKTTVLFPETESELDNEDKPWSCMIYEIEKNKKFFQDSKDTECSHMQRVVFRDIHIATINALKLVCNNRLCISVSRDRSIGVWNVADSAPNTTNAVKQIYPAHEGWVWCLDACNSQTFCTGAWDSTFKVWSLEDFSSIATYKCYATVLSISCTESLVAAGLFNSKLLVFDTRIDPTECSNPIADHVFDKKGVLQGVTLNEQNVYVASANGIVSCFDLRSKEVVKSTAPLCHKKDNVMSYSYRNGTIVIGDTGNTLTILNKNLEVLARTTAQFEDPLQRKLTCIKQNDYDIFVGSKSSLYSYMKSDPIVPLESIQASKYEMTAIEYDFDNVLLHASDLDGEIVMHKRVNNTITL